MRELKFAPFVRLEVDCEMPLEVVQRLTAELGLSDQNDVYTVCGPLALGGASTLEILLFFQMFFNISIKALDEDFPQVVFGFIGYNGNPSAVFMWDRLKLIPHLN